MNSNRFFQLLALLILSGCGLPSLVQPGKPQKVDDFSLTAGREWSQFGFSRRRLWTIDGPELNSIRIYSQIKNGEQVFLGWRDRRRGEGALYKAGMNANEVMELIVDGMSRGGAARVEAKNLRPANLGGHKGFRFDIQFDEGSGLHYLATVLGEAEDGTLSYLIYFAPAEYYFERDRAEVEQLFLSAAARNK
jgi:hypothetical protein